MAKLHIPPEIWLNIANYLSEKEFNNLIGLNSFFYNSIMNTRYGEVHIGNLDYKVPMKRLARLKEPAVGKHVRRLHLNPYFTGQWHHQENNHLQRGLNRVLNLLHDRTHPTPGKFLFLASSNEDDIVDSHPQYYNPINHTLRVFSAAIKSMSNVTDLTLDWWQHPAARHLEPLLPTVWTSLRPTLVSLTLKGSTNSIQMLILPLLPHASPLPALTHLSLTFSETPAALSNRKCPAHALEDTIAPFISTVFPGLSHLSLTAQLDLSPLFTHLPPSSFPTLAHLTLHTPFHLTLADPLTRFLSHTSPTLHSADLVLSPRAKPVSADILSSDPPPPQPSPHLFKWLHDLSTHPPHTHILAHLKHLHLSLPPPPLPSLLFPLPGTPPQHALPSPPPNPLSIVLSLIKRSSHTLTSLSLTGWALSPSDLSALTLALTTSPLTTLTLLIRALTAPLLDLLATRLCALKILRLTLTSSPHRILPVPPSLARELTRTTTPGFYPNWRLEDLGIWNGGEKLNESTMYFIARSVPSIHTFWGTHDLFEDIH